VETRPTLCRGVEVRDGFIFLTSAGHRLPYEGAVRRLRQWTRSICGKAFSLHCLRHTAAIRVYEATRDVLAVQRFLGHRSLQWTESYLRSLVAVDVAGMPGFCTGKPTLRVVSTDRGDDEKAKMVVGPMLANNSTIQPLVAAGPVAAAGRVAPTPPPVASSFQPLPGQRSFSVVSQRTAAAASADAESSTGEVEAAADLVPVRESDHDCYRYEEFGIVAGSDQTALVCSRCGKFLGFVGRKAMARRAQRGFFA